MPRAKAPRAPRLADCAVPPTEQLLATWGERANHLERYAPEVARAIRECADDLRTAIKATADLEVTPTEAAKLTGYTTRAYSDMLADGRVPNLGNKQRPRMRLRDLPRKPGHIPPSDAFDPDVLAFAAFPSGALRE